MIQHSLSCSTQPHPNISCATAEAGPFTQYTLIDYVAARSSVTPKLLFVMVVENKYASSPQMRYPPASAITLRNGFLAVQLIVRLAYHL